MKWKTEEETEFEGMGALTRGPRSLWEREVAACPLEAARKKPGVNSFSGDLPRTVQNVALPVRMNWEDNSSVWN